MKARLAWPGELMHAGLLWLRLAASALLLHVHGWPKLLHYQAQLVQIEDPFGWGTHVSMAAAITAEVLCPIAIGCGLFTRIATLPVLVVLAVAMLAVHPGWSVAQGQSGWLLIFVFVTVALCGPGRWSLDALRVTRYQS